MAFAFTVDTGATLSTGLVAAYNLADTTDDKGGFTLTNGNSTPFVVGINGNGADFESGSSQYLRVANTLGIDGGNISMSCWCKWESSATDQKMAFQSAATSDVENWLALDQSEGLISYYRQRLGVSWARAYKAVTVSNGSWYHLVGTYDGTTIKLYVNGVAGTDGSSSGNGSSASTVDQLNIGGMGRGVPTEQFMDGIIDALYIWSKALSTTEVADLYNSGTGSFYTEAVAGATVPIPGALTMKVG